MGARARGPAQVEDDEGRETNVPTFAGLARRYFLIASGVAFVAGCIVGWVRVLPWVLAPDVPFAAVQPFVVQLLVGAGEAAVLLAAPVAAALATTELRERGEARALFALGVTPWAIAGAIARTLFLPSLAATVLVGVALGVTPQTPLGALAHLSDRVAARCALEERPVALAIPNTAFSWLCGPSNPPLLVGRLPGDGAEFWLTGHALRVDGGALVIEQAALSPRPTPEGHWRARIAELRLPVAASSATLAPGARPFVPALLGAYTSAPLLAGLLLARRRVLPRWFDFALGLLVGCLGVVLLGWRHLPGQPPTFGYLQDAARVFLPPLVVLALVGGERIAAAFARPFARR
jgi:hypothetical protein